MILLDIIIFFCSNDCDCIPVGCINRYHHRSMGDL